jgi:hypothetical protein
MSKIKYPILGYAPGQYQCKCVTCEIMFVAHPKSVQCEPCAINAMNEGLTSALTRIGELEKEVERVKKVAANAFHEFRMRGFPHNEPTWEQFKTANNL